MHNLNGDGGPSASGRRSAAWPAELFGRAAPDQVEVEDRRGTRATVDVARWNTPPGTTDAAVLDRVLGPTLDIGCGPGRLVQALTRRGHEALGIDVSAAAVRETRRRGAPALLASVFDDLPSAGRWSTALLIDGNIGIGGEPVILLRRVAEILGPTGRVLVETDPPWASPLQGPVRVLRPDGPGPWFPWCGVAAPDLALLAARAGMVATERWTHGGRWFADVRQEALASSDVA